MIKRHSSVSEDAKAAAALADPARIAERMRAYNDSLDTYTGPFNRWLDWPTFSLAVIGAVVALCAFAFLVLPVLVVGFGKLGAFSLKFWGLA